MKSISLLRNLLLHYITYLSKKFHLYITYSILCIIYIIRIMCIICTICILCIIYITCIIFTIIRAVFVCTFVRLSVQNLAYGVEKKYIASAFNSSRQLDKLTTAPLDQLTILWNIYARTYQTRLSLPAHETASLCMSNSFVCEKYGTLSNYEVNSFWKLLHISK